MNAFKRSLCPLGGSHLRESTHRFVSHRFHPSRLHSIGVPRGTSYKIEDYPELQYEPIEDVEKLHRYRAGGYHPVAINDRLHDDRYRIVHKLGHGAYSTAWLARDERAQRLVAVKIGTAESNRREMQTLSALNLSPHCSSQPSGRSLIPPLLDSFDIHGPNGTHPSYVTTVARGSLSDAKEGFSTNMFQLDVARCLAAQLALAVQYMHSKGFVHGDLHLGNILLQMPPGFDRLSDQQLYDEYDAPEPEPVVYLLEQPLPPGVPIHAFMPIWLGKPSEDITLSESQIFLSDYGESFQPSQEERHESHTPVTVRPPEAFLEPSRPLSYESDIWTLACAFWSVIAQGPLFYDFIPTEDGMIREHVDALGILPPELWASWGERGTWFTETSKPIKGNSEAGDSSPDRSTRSWSDRFETGVQEPRRKYGMTPLEEDERRAFLTMLRGMLAYKPEDRTTVKQVLESEWMTKWALPAYNKMNSEKKTDDGT